MQLLEKDIEEFILGTDDKKWMPWYEQVKEGKVIVQEF